MIVHPFRPGLLTRILCALTLASIGSSHALAQDIYDNGAMNTIDIPSLDIEVRDSGSAAATTVDIVGGAQVGFSLEGDGTISMQDDGEGGMEPVISNPDRSVAIFDNSVVNMSAGETAESVEINNNGIFNLSGGSIGNDVVANDNATVAISGGEFDDLFVSGTASATMSGGSIDNPEVSAGTFNFTGGRVDDMQISGTALVTTADGAHIDDDAFFTGNSRLETTGGQYDDELQFFDDTSALFNGGNVGDDLVVAGNAQVIVNDLNVNDTLEASGGMTTINGGSFGAVEAASGAVVQFNSGSVEDGLFASLGGSALLANVAMPDGAVVSSVLNGQVTVNGATAANLPLEAGNAGRVRVEQATADSIAAAAIAEGSIALLGGSAASLDITAELGGTVDLRGGQFDAISARVESGGSLTILGSSIEVNGTPLAELDAIFGDGAYIAETGEIRVVAGNITGTLLDGSPFAMSFSRQFAPIDETGQIFAVPEPSTLATLLVGLLAAGGMTRSRRS